MIGDTDGGSPVAFTCDSCGTRSRLDRHRTATGRTLCTACHESLLGAAAGLVAGGGVGGAVATAGWFARIRDLRRRAARRGDEDAGPAR